MCYFFFFQAEDGIRDTSVTGVQTCALPILFLRDARAGHLQHVEDLAAKVMRGIVTQEVSQPVHLEHPLLNQSRSEERRVGKECISRWWRRPLEKKIEEE